jgi:putative membrane protein
MWNDSSGWWVVMPLATVLFWGAVIWLVVIFVRGLSGRPSGDGAERPDEILARRYARGEIDEDEYRRRLDTLRGTARAGGQQ